MAGGGRSDRKGPGQPPVPFGQFLAGDRFAESESHEERGLMTVRGSRSASNGFGPFFRGVVPSSGNPVRAKETTT